jgi:formate dehydrogenase subunit gamma
MTEPIQPNPPAIETLDRIDALIAEHRNQPGALLPLLQAVQDACGHVPDAAVPRIARALQRSVAEVHGVLTYYHDFRRTPPGRHVVKICRAEACQACGAEALLEHAERVFRCRRHETRADGHVTLEAVYCLGLCAQSPAVCIDDKQHALVTPERLLALAAELEAP